MQNYKKICELLDNELCKPFVNKLFNINPAQIALQYRDKIPCDASVLALIIQLYKKAADKLPLWVQNYCALTPRSLEQSTSQIVALYKSTFMAGKKLLVLGGGLGVDEWAFSHSFNTILSVDPDKDLNEIVAFNYPKLKIKNVERITATAEEYLQHAGTVDCIYTDPDRRDDKGARKITLSQSEPDIPQLLPLLWQYTKKLVVKASPLLDITAAIAELPGISEVRVIAVKNEVKEILLTAQKDYTAQPVIIAANYDGKTWQEFSSTQKQLPGKTEGKYFFEPSVAIIKAGLHHTYAAQLGLGLIDVNTAYYTGQTIPENFMGRFFEIIHRFEFSKKQVAHYLNANTITQANIARRNFRMTTDELKKLFKIKDGGEDYLFFTTGEGKGIVFHCRRPKNGDNED